MDIWTKTSLGFFLMFSAAGIANAGNACSPYVEEQPKWHTATFRPHTDAFLDCPVSEETYRRVVSAWTNSRDADTGELDSFGLGRAVQYPWLSKLIAETAITHPNWDVSTGSSMIYSDNEFVNKMLSHPEVLSRLQIPFSTGAYVIARVTVEKVLIDEVGKVLPDQTPVKARIPFDAIVWLHLLPNENE